ncbi:DUF6415 family natural product biosynthesis protein [Streptomyces sp. NPDC006012]|uniref:DUF6415 family natural product biosynthesis protein n=1 Tax=Streptomyces sp. NPDC006012 TaxID=3364739 RepID=UPI0036CC645A
MDGRQNSQTQGVMMSRADTQMTEPGTQSGVRTASARADDQGIVGEAEGHATPGTVRWLAIERLVVSHWTVPMREPGLLGDDQAVSQLVLHGGPRTAAGISKPEPMSRESAVIDLERAHRTWSEVLLLTRDLPEKVPPRDRLDPLVEELRVYVEDLIRYVMEALTDEEDSYDRRTTQWLLDRVRKVLAAEPAPTDREAAERAEDLALSCRALAGIHERQHRHGAGGSHA